MATVTAKVESNKLGKIVTPVGSALYNSGINPSPYDENKIEASLIISGDEWEAMVAQIKGLYDAVVAEGTKMVLPFEKAKFPVKPSVDRDGNETGDMIIKAKTSIKYQPAFFDAQGKPFKPAPGFVVPNRTKMRLQLGVEIVKSGLYSGIVFRLNGEKLIEVPNYSSDAFDGYDDEGTFGAEDATSNVANNLEEWAD